MKKMLALSIVLAACGALAAAPATGTSSGALAFVPEDATSVGFIRLADLRSNPFQLRIFEETDKIAADGDGARFLEEAGLHLREDVDSVVVCTSSADGRPGQSLVFFEGRFDPARLVAAVTKRGAHAYGVRGGSYFRLKQESGGEHGPGAVAFVDAHLIIAGAESAVVTALSNRASGGHDFASGGGLGREYHRVNPAATAWVLVDVDKWRPSRISLRGDGASAGLVSALKTVSLVTFEATVEGDSLAVKGTGLSSDEETRGLLEDSLRGVTAAWRLAAQEKSPQLVAAIRKIQISHDGEGVTISGKLPGDLIRSLAASARTQTGK